MPPYVTPTILVRKVTMPDYASISSKSAIGSLTLLQLQGVGNKTADQLSRAFTNLEAIQDAAQGDGLRMLRRVPRDLRNQEAWDHAYEAAERILEQAVQHNTRILTAFDDEYPELLKQIDDRPVVLFVKGHLRSGKRNVACIGTRTPSEFGVRETRRMVKKLVEDNWSIVSGLATGIDAVAHRQALESHGHTVAVLANGLDTIFPTQHRDLARQILDSGGALLSEYKFGTAGLQGHLVQRNRIQSGMSAGTLVMQTDIKGGSMHTARFTLTQRRKLFAPVPVGEDSQHPKCRGILALTSCSGPELVPQLAEPPGDYVELLQNQFRRHPPATPIDSNGDGSDVCQKLREQIE
jgi:DNA processing protein